MLPANSKLFAIEDTNVDVEFSFTFHFVDVLPEAGNSSMGLPWEITYQRPNIIIWNCNGLERRRLSFNGQSHAYAVYEESSNTHADIWYLTRLKNELNIDTLFISTLSLERHLAPHGAYILHCAYLNHQGEAILFSGPSGAGKSTHANLWEQMIPETHLVNGDRCLICREDDGSFQAFGWPICGSSGICRVENHRIRAIVFIEQTPENQVIVERPARLFSRLFSQITVNHWDATATATAADWTAKLMQHVSVMVYGCNMAPDAPYPLLTHLNQIANAPCH